jgi:predicted acylesterase/phospholipase RssA
MEEYGRRGRYAILAAELELADVVVSPRTAPARMLDFEHKETNIAAGSQAAREVLPRIEAAIARAAGKKTGRGT